MTDAPARPGAAAAPPPLAHPTSRSTGGMRARRRPLPAHRRLPQDRRRASCARPTWPRARRSTRRAGARTRWSRRSSQPDPRAALGDERLHEILDLCLECKACKSECPLERRHGVAEDRVPLALPGRSTACRCARGCSARSGRLNRLGAATAPLSNLPGCRRGAARALARDRRRAPAAALRARDAAPLGPQPRSGRAAPRGEVVFLADSFTTFTEPASAAPRSSCSRRAGLAACGSRARGCCGRASISKGLLDQARADGRGDDRAARARRRARRADRRRASRRACSRCARSTSRCCPATRARRRSPAQARLVEELLVEAIDEGDLRAARRLPAGRGSSSTATATRRRWRGTAATRRAARAHPGRRGRSSSTPAAAAWPGSFGFEAEHYELSMQIGELRLFPALRGEAARTRWSPRPACRAASRSRTACGRRARHPVELVRSCV